MHHQPKNIFDSGGPNYFLVVIGAIGVVWGIGLLAKIEFIRGITNVLCFLSIAVDLLSLVGYVLGAGLAAMLGGSLLVVISMFATAFNIALNGLMIYLLGETD